MNTREPSSGPSSPARPSVAQRVFTWIGIAGVPAIWVAHLLVSTTLIATACAGGVQQRNALPWPAVETAIRSGSALAFVVALVCTLLAWRAWRAAAHAAHAHARADAQRDGRDHGKHRFLALCGAMISTGFTAALVFTASVMIAASPTQLCAPFP
jgi:hypothetical protein